MLRNYIISLCIVISLSFLFSCSSEKGLNEEKKLAARINDFQLSQEKFNEELALEMEYNSDYKITADAKNQFMDSLIERELLIQEAKKRGLDREDKFKYAIEKYWKATLIKHLMEEKNREILQQCIVSDKEIKARYDMMKEENSSLPPFEQVEKEIAEELLEEKRTGKMEEWTASLRDSADIDINSDFMNQ